MLSQLRYLGRSLLDFVYPAHCLACGTAVADAGDALCAACWDEILTVRPVRCGRCCCPLQAPAPSCVNCASWDPGLERAVVLSPFAGAVQEAIHAVKFRQQPALGCELGRRFARAPRLAAILREVDLLIPVPLHPARRRERGYNQSLHIATGLAEVLGLPVCPQLLRRRRPTRQQTRLDADERRRNLRGAFEVTAELPAHTCIGVVDDVVTTAATLAACAQALGQAGARRVWGVALACPFQS